jgi:hypothetical protein
MGVWASLLTLGVVDNYRRMVYIVPMPYASKEERAEYNRKYQQSHKEKLREYTKLWHRKWRANNPEKAAAERLAWRLANKELVRFYGRKCKKKHLEAYRAADRERQKISRWKNPEKWIAHTVVAYAIAAGDLIRPLKCSRCGRKCKPDAHHHRGYTPKHWLDVIWLCVICHQEERR